MSTSSPPSSTAAAAAAASSATHSSPATSAPLASPSTPSSAPPSTAPPPRAAAVMTSAVKVIKPSPSSPLKVSPRSAQSTAQSLAAAAHAAAASSVPPLQQAMQHAMQQGMQSQPPPHAAYKGQHMMQHPGMMAAGTFTGAPPGYPRVPIPTTPGAAPVAVPGGAPGASPSTSPGQAADGMSMLTNAVHQDPSQQQQQQQQQQVTMMQYLPPHMLAAAYAGNMMAHMAAYQPHAVPPMMGGPQVNKSNRKRRRKPKPKRRKPRHRRHRSSSSSSSSSSGSGSSSSSSSPSSSDDDDGDQRMGPRAAWRQMLAQPGMPGAPMYKPGMGPPMMLTPMGPTLVRPAPVSRSASSSSSQPERKRRKKGGASISVPAPPRSEQLTPEAVEHCFKLVAGKDVQVLAVGSTAPGAERLRVALAKTAEAAPAEARTLYTQEVTLGTVLQELGKMITAGTPARDAVVVVGDTFKPGKPLPLAVGEISWMSLVELLGQWKARKLFLVAGNSVYERATDGAKYNSVFPATPKKCSVQLGYHRYDIRVYQNRVAENKQLLPKAELFFRIEQRRIASAAMPYLMHVWYETNDGSHRHFFIPTKDVSPNSFNRNIKRCEQQLGTYGRFISKTDGASVDVFAVTATQLAWEKQRALARRVFRRKGDLPCGCFLQESCIYAVFVSDKRRTGQIHLSFRSISGAVCDHIVVSRSLKTLSAQP